MTKRIDPSAKGRHDYHRTDPMGAPINNHAIIPTKPTAERLCVTPLILSIHLRHDNCIEIKAAFE